MEIKIDVQGVTQLSRNLRIFVDSLQNMQPFYSEAVDLVKARSDKIFADKWTSVQKWQKWKPLAASTLKARGRRSWYYANSPSRPSTLRWTGNLQDNVTKTITPKWWSLKYNAPYAVYHQEWWGNLPQRPIIDLDNTTNAELIRLLQKKVDQDIGIFGLQA